MKRLVVTICMLAIMPVCVFSQETGLPVLKGPYLGQKLPGITPEIFAPGIVSTDAHEFSCSFTPDGKEFYFTRRDPTLNKPVVMTTRIQDGAWTKPEVAPFVKNQMSFELLATPDNSRLYFSSGEPIPGQTGPPMNILFVEREGDGWSIPKNPGPPFNPARTMYVSSTLDGTIYTTDISEGPGKEWLAVIKKVDGKYQQLERLGPPLGGETQNMYPFVAPDESYLIYTSKQPSERIAGTLSISFRKSDGAWSKPQVIDLGMRAALPFVSPDGKYLFFTSGEQGKSDIYWVSAEIIDKLKKGAQW
jgi:hypothetical protein